MRSVQDYLELALTNPAIENASEISRRIGIKPSAITRFKLGHALPTDDNMMKLADLAGVSREEALLDLMRWKAKSDEARAVYVEIAKRLGYLSLAVTLAVIFLGGDAVAEEARTLAEQTISEDPEFINCATLKSLIRRLISSIARTLRVSTRVNRRPSYRPVFALRSRLTA